MHDILAASHQESSGPRDATVSSLPTFSSPIIGEVGLE